MIAKITRGQNPGSIGAYVHGPGKANEHAFTLDGKRYSGGIVVASNFGAQGLTAPDRWVGQMRNALKTRSDIKNAVWQVSLRLAPQDPWLSDSQWADAAQSFAEKMGFAEHPWTAVRHADDHVHIVVARVNFGGEVWHGRNDRRQAQTVCTSLEREYGLSHAPRRRVGEKKSVVVERQDFKDKAQRIEAERVRVEKQRQLIANSFVDAPPGVRGGLVQDSIVRPPLPPIHFEQRGRGL